MNKLMATTDSCEICAEEYIKKETDKLAHLPNDQTKTAKINQIIHSALRATTKPVIRIPCRGNVSNCYHNYCSEHLYKMLDIIKEYEDDCNDPSVS